MFASVPALIEASPTPPKEGLRESLIQHQHFMLRATVLLSSSVASHSCTALTQMGIMQVQIYETIVFYKVRVYKAPPSEVPVREITKLEGRPYWALCKPLCLFLKPHYQIFKLPNCPIVLFAT